jgi:hypothetical protein
MSAEHEDERTDEEVAQSARESLSKLTPEDGEDADGTTRDAGTEPDAAGN